MTIKRRMDCQGLVTTEISGHIGTTDILNAVLELGELTAYASQLWELMILDPRVSVDRENHTSIEMAHNAKEIVQFKSRGAIAIVATTEVCRKWGDDVAALLRGDVVPVTVFTDEGQARRWLAIHMEQARIEATTVRKPRIISGGAARQGS